MAAFNKNIELLVEMGRKILIVYHRDTAPEYYDCIIFEPNVRKHLDSIEYITVRGYRITDYILTYTDLTSDAHLTNLNKMIKIECKFSPAIPWTYFSKFI